MNIFNRDLSFDHQVSLYGFKQTNTAKHALLCSHHTRDTTQDHHYGSFNSY